jgi:subtilisin family serine protease
MNGSGPRVRRTTATVALVFALSGLGFADASATGTQRVMGAAPVGQVTVEVVLKAQADLSNIVATSRRDRIIKVVRALRSTATSGQRSLLALLQTREAEHTVSKVVPLWLSDAILVTATPTVIAEIAARTDVRAVLPERTIQAPAPESRDLLASTSTSTSTVTASAAAAEQNIDRVDAPAVWGQGYVGQGVVIASLDTGVDATHPDLAGGWRGGTNSWFDPYGEHPTTPTDVSGHGTQTMGIIVGGSAGGTAIGVAPSASWIAAKIFDDRGVATTTAIHQAFQWVLDPDNNPATADSPAIVNNSWDDQTTSCSAEFQPDLAALRAAGILPVFAAGNDGPMDGSVLNPANLPEALSAGGTDDADVIDPSSSRGPSTCGQPVSPTVTAPDTAVRTTDLYGGYVTATGTSLAAPHVSGALALLLSARPTLTAEQLQTALTDGTVDLGPVGPDQTYGAGRIDVLDSYESLAPVADFAVTVAPASRTVPPGGSASYDVSVGATNGFTGDVTLDLTGLGPSQATWSFTPALVPGGSGTSTLSLTTSASLAPGSYPLTIAATSGALTHSVSAALVVAPPPDFTLDAAPTSATVAAGSATHVTLTVSSLNGFGDDVSLVATGLPAGVGSATIQPGTVTGSGTVDLALSTVSGATTGTYPVTVTATSGSLVHSVSVSLTVTSAATPDFALAVTPTSRSILRGKAAAFVISVSSLGGFTGKVKLTRSGVPPAATTNWVTKTVLAPGSATLRVRTTTGTPRGTYLLVVTGGCGGISHQVSMTLVVR